ncbi:MAG: uracil-DNA glycosylase [Gammaproteobacteria bacterium]|nr:MAG: uracil-DNA glycosylase [Gammaproteobacteria bacterium]RLA54773.1 MAG: uracil-DNA glycosylase [Gammaproteobacteria bacterium]
MQAQRSVKLHPSWLKVLGEEFDKPYMTALRAFLVAEKEQGKVIYPTSANWFTAFDKTPFDEVKVVILGQDPYHGANQAHGLCFSVLPGVATPPSLVNIYKELDSDLGIPPAAHGCLNHWAEQGVLLLNATLTVVGGQAGSHQNQGWETFTDRAIEVLNEQRQGLVFILWGSYAQKKGSMINRDKHCVIRSPHPSPLSAYRGFFGSKPFSKANDYLQSKGSEPIDWRLSVE